MGVPYRRRTEAIHNRSDILSIERWSFVHQRRLFFFLSANEMQGFSEEGICGLGGGGGAEDRKGGDTMSDIVLMWLCIPLSTKGKGGKGWGRRGRGEN